MRSDRGVPGCRDSVAAESITSKRAAPAEGRRSVYNQEPLPHGGTIPKRIHRSTSDMAKARVAVLKTEPESILEDVGRTMEMADVRRPLAPGATTILKDNISWHFPFPGANTTPWQLEGTIQALREAGWADQVCVQNNTVVTDPKKGE